MDIISILIGAILLGAAAVFVNRPFQQEAKSQGPNEGTAEPRTRRESVLSALLDLDFDYKTGKVSEEDYAPLRTQLLAEAADLTRLEQEKEDELEALIRSRRNRKGGARCGQCGAALIAGQHFCSKCGAPASLEACPSCGSRVKPGDSFCTTCGSRLRIEAKAAGGA